MLDCLADESTGYSSYRSQQEPTQDQDWPAGQGPSTEIWNWVLIVWTGGWYGLDNREWRRVIRDGELVRSDLRFSDMLWEVAMLCVAIRSLHHIVVQLKVASYTTSDGLAQAAAVAL